jgi:activator of 2-hydroxyglutaryl-CoA dehydratase
VKRLYGGIDIGSESHHIVIIGENEQIHYDGKVPHRLHALAEVIGQFRELEKNNGGTVTFAIEGKNGYGGFETYSVLNGETTSEMPQCWRRC